MTTANTLSWMPRKKLPVSEKKVAIGARINPQLLDQLETLADADQRSLSFMVERAVREWLERNEPAQPRPRKLDKGR